jgi:phosphoserine phosphatase RsbX
MAAFHLPMMECGVARRARSGETVSGDISSVQDASDGVLLAVVDGLGHGYSAELAARIAVATIAPWGGRPLLQLFADCHAVLEDTRGAVMALAAIDARESTLTWIAVGNIEGRLLHRSTDGTYEKKFLKVHGGIVGHRIPTLRSATLSIVSGDLVVLATDGIDNNFDQELRVDLPPQKMADHVLVRCGKHTDDALILVGRWIGPHEGD